MVPKTRQNRLKTPRTHVIIAGAIACGGAVATLSPNSFGAEHTRQPAQSAVRRRSLTDAQLVAAQRVWRATQVRAALMKLLTSRISSPGGRPNIALIPGERADLGYFNEISASGRPAQVKKLRITELSLRARNVQIDVAALLERGELVTLRSQTTLRAVITESDLTAMLAQGRHTRPMGLHVKYLGDRLRVTGNFSWGWFNGPVDGIAKLRMTPGHLLYLDILSLKLNGAEVPGWLKEKFSERINPVLDYSDIPFHPQFKSLTLKGNRAILVA